MSVDFFWIKVNKSNTLMKAPKSLRCRVEASMMQCEKTESQICGADDIKYFVDKFRQ